LLNRSYNSLEWALSSPPKPHAFVSLPLQSFTCSSKLFATASELEEVLDEYLDEQDRNDENSESHYENEPAETASEEVKDAWEAITEAITLADIELEDKIWAVTKRLEDVENGKVDTRPAEDFDRDIDEVCPN
jgi:hypothetical protein